MVQTNLIGRLGADATSKEFPEIGRFAINFIVCVNVRKKNNVGVYEDYPQWYKVTYFCKSTALLLYLKKGAQVFVSGEPLFESYVSQTTNATVFSVTVTASRVELLGSKQEEGQKQEK